MIARTKVKTVPWGEGAGWLRPKVMVFSPGWSSQLLGGVPGRVPVDVHLLKGGVFQSDAVLFQTFFD